MTYFGFTLEYYDMPAELHYWDNSEFERTEAPLGYFTRPIIPISLEGLLANAPEFRLQVFCAVIKELYSAKFITAEQTKEILTKTDCERARELYKTVVEFENKQQQIAAQRKHEEQLADLKRRADAEREARRFTKSKLDMLVQLYFVGSQDLQPGRLVRYFDNPTDVEMHLTAEEYADLSQHNNYYISRWMESPICAYTHLGMRTQNHMYATAFGNIKIVIRHGIREMLEGREQILKDFFPEYGQEPWRIA